MRVLVDTVVWSLALRRQQDRLSPAESLLVASWSDLVTDGRIVLVGIVRQEVLSGVPDTSTFERLHEQLGHFPDEPLLTADHVRAAEMFNTCRSRGIQCAAIDILLCAMAERLTAALFTTDADFEIYARHVPVRLFRPRTQA